ncbi:hypothetical protein ACIO7M_24880 [Streptomyces toxytricini]|uniref:Uncharacterized protein n=1 Tax=Streptomyces toxytricini TaxID=67369 RepID=A0ABW8EM39_STRT5
MEHIRARPGPDGIGLVLFIRAARPHIAQAKARRLVYGTLASGPTGAHGYSVTLHH